MHPFHVSWTISQISFEFTLSLPSLYLKWKFQLSFQWRLSSMCLLERATECLESKRTCNLPNTLDLLITLLNHLTLYPATGFVSDHQCRTFIIDLEPAVVYSETHTYSCRSYKIINNDDLKSAPSDSDIVKVLHQLHFILDTTAS